MSQRPDPVRRALAELKEAGETPPRELLKKSLRSKTGVVVAAAAKRLVEHPDESLEADLVAAFDRLEERGSKRDPGCTGKFQVLKALHAQRCLREDLYRRATRLVQREPVWGGSEDTAGALRGLALEALMELAPRDAVWLLARGLRDPVPITRRGAVEACLSWGRPAAVGMLRLRLDAEDDGLVAGDLMAGMLALDPEAAVEELVAMLQGGPWESTAALALGESRRPDALEALIARYAQRRTSDLITAVSLVRSEAALDWLLTRMAQDEAPFARAAVEAMDVYRFHSGALDNARRAVRRNPHVDLAARLEEVAEAQAPQFRR